MLEWPLLLLLRRHGLGLPQVVHQRRNRAALYDHVDNILCAIDNNQIRLSAGAGARIGAVGWRELPFLASSARTWVARLAAARSS